MFYLGTDGKTETQLTIDSSQIAQGTKKIVNTPQPDLQWQDMTDPHYQVWMNISPSDLVIKSYGKLDLDFQPGTYRLDIQNNYDRAKQNQNNIRVIFMQTSIYGTLNLTFVYWQAGIWIVMAILVIAFKMMNNKNNWEKRRKMQRAVNRKSFIYQFTKPINTKVIM